MTHRLVKPASSAARAISASVAAVVAGWPGQPKRETCRPKSSGIGSSCGEPRRAGAVTKSGGTSATGPAAWTPANPSPASCSPARSGLAELGGDDLRRHRGRPARGCARAPRPRRVEHDGVGRHAAAIGQPTPRAATLGIQAGGVDHRGQAAPQPLGDDQVEHLERVAARALVALAQPHDGTQAVRGDDLLVGEPGARPVRLPGRRGPDQHDEAGIGKPQRDAHARRCTGPWTTDQLRAARRRQRGNPRPLRSSPPRPSPERRDDVPIRVVLRAAQREEPVGCADAELARQVEPAVADVGVGRSHRGARPVHDAADLVAGPEHVARVEVAMDEAARVRRRRAAEQVERPLPDRGTPRPGRRAIRVERVRHVVLDDRAAPERRRMNLREQSGETREVRIEPRRAPLDRPAQPRHEQRRDGGRDVECDQPRHRQRALAQQLERRRLALRDPELLREPVRAHEAPQDRWWTAPRASSTSTAWTADEVPPARAAPTARGRRGRSPLRTSEGSRRAAWSATADGRRASARIRAAPARPRPRL